MVDTLIITTHRKDLVQGEIGDGVARLLKKPVDVAQFDEIEFVLDDDVEVLWKQKKLESYNKIIMYGGVSRLLRIAHPLAIALKAKGVDVFTSSAENYRGVDKLTQNTTFALNGFKIPKTYYGRPQNLLKNAASYVGFPMILKDILSSQGERNYLVHSQDELDEKLIDMEQDRYIAQEYIENDGDLRVLINASGDTCTFKRSASDGGHLNNTSAGGGAELINAPEGLIEECQRLLNVMEIELSGIDVIRRGNVSYFLEANLQPMIFTGAFPEKKREVFRKAIS